VKAAVKYKWNKQEGKNTECGSKITGERMEFRISKRRRMDQMC
jgi:hypothetical protein